MEIPFIFKLMVASVLLSSLLVSMLCISIIREQIRNTKWYLRRKRKEEILHLLEFGNELVDSLEAYTVDRLTEAELKDYLAGAVVNYTYREYSDSQMAWEMEKAIWPEKFKNPHYIPYAMADVSLPTLRLALLVLNNSTHSADWKREIIKLAEISAFACVNKLYYELESL